MPRRSKGPYLYWVEYKNGRAPQWVIRDGTKMRSTGLGDGASEDEKSAALAKYLIEKHDPKPQGIDNPNEALSGGLPLGLSRKEALGLRSAGIRQARPWPPK